MLISLNPIEPDLFVPAPQCGEWAPWTPPPAPLTVAAPGDYWVGELALGEWYVPDGCLWSRSSTSGGLAWPMWCRPASGQGC